MCPVCTVTVVAGLGLSRFLGIDDVVVSIWIGALILSLSFVTYNWLSKKWPKLKNTYYLLLTIFLMYAFAIVPLWLNGSIDMKTNCLWGIDKILLGMGVGSIVFLLGAWADKKVRKVRGKQLFPYQKVVFPVLLLIIVSLIFYFITKGSCGLK